jgi:amidase
MPVAFAAPVRVALCLPDRCSGAQQGAARAAALALGTLGAQIEERPAPDALGAAAGRLARLVLTASLAEWMASMGVADVELSPLAAAIAAEGRALPATALFAASREMAQLSGTVWQMFDRIDVLLSPVLSGPPPVAGAFDMTRADPAAHFAQMEATAPNAALANVAGCPALVLPFGTDAAGLPLGVQLMGPIGSDLALLSLGARLAALAPPVAFPAPIAGHP